jgi:hypothetical protein
MPAPAGSQSPGLPLRDSRRRGHDTRLQELAVEVCTGYRGDCELAHHFGHVRMTSISHVESGKMVSSGD